MEMEAMLTTQDVLPAVIWGSLLTIIILLAIWEMIWKGIALWHAGNKNN